MSNTEKANDEVNDTTPYFDDSTDEQLIRRYIAGDQNALQGLMAKYNGKLRRWLNYRMYNRHQDIDDVVQETWIIVCRRLEQLNDYNCFYGWLYAICYNEYKQWVEREVKTKTSHERGHITPTSDEPSTVVMPTENELFDLGLTTEDLQQMIDRLPTMHRDIVRAVFFDQVRNRDLAAKYGKKTQHISAIVDWAVTELRKMIINEVDGRLGNGFGKRKLSRLVLPKPVSAL